MRRLLLTFAALAAAVTTAAAAPVLAQQTPGPMQTPITLHTPVGRITPLPLHTLPPKACLPAATNVVRCPDLLPRSPVIVGGHSTAWGGGVTLTDADSLPGPRPYCAFDIVYTMVNAGTLVAGPPPFPVFKNRLRVDGVSIVSIQSSLSLAAGAAQTIHTQAYLPMGVHQLSISLDDDNVIPESNEANNHAAIKYQLTGKCKNR